MNCLSIFLDTDKFELPQQNSVVLETFWAVKAEMLKHLKSIEGEIFGNPCFIVIAFRPDKIGIDYLIENLELEKKVKEIINQNVKLDKIGESINSAKNN